MNAWDLRPWEQLLDRFDISCVVTGSNEFPTGGLSLPMRATRAWRDWLPRGRTGRALAYAIGDRYHGLDEALDGADIVHSAELHTWFSAQAARLRTKLDFRLVLTVWETIPFLDTYRWPRERRYRRTVIPSADLLLPATERAARTLRLEGVQESRISVCYPGIDTARFSADLPHPAAEPAVHTILSPGRLVWEKGHQDVLRAVAAVRSGLVDTRAEVKLVIVGSGPEEKRLRRYARELGLAGAVQFRPSVPYDEMPELYRSASAMVLASLPRRGWEEQFGMVLAEAMASGTPVVAARSGAIPEVARSEAALFDPGDWFGLATALVEGPLRQPPAARVPHDPERVKLFSAEAAAARLAVAYDRVMATASASA